MEISRDLVDKTIEAISDLMGEVVGASVVQSWARVNKVLIELERMKQRGD